MNLSTILTIAAAIAEQHPGCDDVVMDFVDELYAALTEQPSLDGPTLDADLLAAIDRSIEAVRTPTEPSWSVLTWRRALSAHFGSDYHQVLADIADCEQCGRTKGHLCETVDGNVAKQPHAVRVRDAHRETRGTLPEPAWPDTAPFEYV